MFAIVEKVGINLEKDKLLYLFTFIEDYIEKNIYGVLNDSKVDPHFSAVTTTNIIKCYIDIQTQIGNKPPYIDVKSYFKHIGFSPEEFESFEKSRKNEAEYYCGIQY